jgi:thiamine-phosphate pyrophosphorylase
MAEDQPQIYLISPPAIDRDAFAGALAAVLDARPVACFRLALSGTDEDSIARDADAMLEVCHARDVPIVIERHFRLAARLGLDGVHLPDGARLIRDARKELGDDGIVGAFCSASRHSGLSAGEAGADYVAFGPVAAGNLGDGTLADHDLFAWWSEMIEVPVVAEGGLTPDLVASLSPVADFLGVAEIWKDDDPVAALDALVGRRG